METKEETNLTETTTESKQHTVNHRKPRYYHREIKKIRAVLLGFAMIYTFGLHPAVRDIDYIVFSFAVPAFFIISGYLVLRESKNIENRILRAIKRTAVCFIILAVVYFALSVAVEPKTTIAAVTSKTFWLDFIVLNVWSLPIGSTIWFVQAMLYAYILIYIIYKLNLLKFDIYIAVICLAVTFICGDLASIIGFNLFGHTYLGGNFLTRALPYILIGCFMHRKNKYFAKLKITHYLLINFIGLALSFIEFFSLATFNKATYFGHTLGTPLTAVSVCLFAFLFDRAKLKSDYFKTLSRSEMMIPYFVCSPVYYFLVEILKLQHSEFAYYIGNIVSLLVIIISYAILYVYAYIRKAIQENKEADEDDEQYNDDDNNKKEYKIYIASAGSDEK